MPDTVPETLHVTDRSRLRRYHERGRFDRETIYTILDAQPMCSVGYIMDGAPLVTPTLQWRVGDMVYWHGSSASLGLRASRGAQVCLSVAILDGFVLARSGMHHSVNSRSVTLFGMAQQVMDVAHKREVLGAFVDGLFPGRYATLRPDTEQDIKATMVLSMKIEEGSAKIRAGGPKDDEADYDLPIWAGVIPVKMRADAPLTDHTPHPCSRAGPCGSVLPRSLSRAAPCAARREHENARCVRRENDRTFRQHERARLVAKQARAPLAGCDGPCARGAGGRRRGVDLASAPR